MLKLKVKLSFWVGVLAVSITLVESFIHLNNLSKLKLYYSATGGQTFARHQMTSVRLIEVFLVKTALSLQWPESLLVSLPAEGATGKGLFPLQDRLTTTFDQRGR